MRFIVESRVVTKQTNVATRPAMMAPGKLISLLPLRLTYVFIGTLSRQSGSPRSGSFPERSIPASCFLFLATTRPDV
jgi:hypothetical protein